MTGAVFMLNVLSEHEECRVCLDPGLKRPCCNHYYCDDCYYKLPVCRSCGSPVGQKLEGIFHSVRVIPIIIGIVISLFFVAIVAAGTFVAVINDLQTPTGIFDYKCYGFFPKCNEYVCVDTSLEVAYGKEAIAPLSRWKPCTLDSLAKIETQACVYDQALFESTRGVFGYDICLDQFAEGVYIFEDTFDAWKNSSSYKSNTMKTANWKKIVNGRSNNWCDAFSGTKSLSFAGPFVRYAETIELDISTGGWLEAMILLPPIGYDILHPFCPTNYAGAIDVEYLTSPGGNWTLLEKIDPVKQRSSSFFKLKFEFEANSLLNQTRFRFNQPFFNDFGDGWALDDVKVFRKLPSNWLKSDQFRNNIKVANKEIQRAQCCFDTEWCETRFTIAEMDSCKDDIPYYNGRRYIIRGAEIFVAFAVLIAIVKTIYIAIMDLLMRKRLPFQDEIEDLSKLERIMKYIPPRFRPRKNLEDYITNIHKSARLEGELRNQFQDEEGEGEMEKTPDEIRAEKAKAQAKIRKQKERQLRKYRKERKDKKIDEPSRDELLLVADLKQAEKEEEEEKVIQDITTKFGTDKLASKTDKLKRSNFGKLRTAFDTKVFIEWHL